METQTPKRHFSKADIVVIIVASLYCAVLVVLPLKLVLVKEMVDVVFSDELTNELGLLTLVIALGVLGSSLRSVAELIVSVGTRKFDRSWTLSYLIRPFEGAGIAVIVYIAMRAGIGFLDRGDPNPSPLGFLAIAALSGMFAHKAAQGLAERFEHFMGKADKKQDRKKDADRGSQKPVN